MVTYSTDSRSTQRLQSAQNDTGKLLRAQQTRAHRVILHYKNFGRGSWPSILLAAMNKMNTLATTQGPRLQQDCLAAAFSFTRVTLAAAWLVRFQKRFLLRNPRVFCFYAFMLLYTKAAEINSLKSNLLYIFTDPNIRDSISFGSLTSVPSGKI